MHYLPPWLFCSMSNNILEGLTIFYATGHQKNYYTEGMYLKELFQQGFIYFRNVYFIITYQNS